MKPDGTMTWLDMKQEAERQNWPDDTEIVHGSTGEPCNEISYEEAITEGGENDIQPEETSAALVSLDFAGE